MLTRPDLNSNPAQEKRLLHRERPDGLTVEFTLGHTDDLRARTQKLIPFDGPEEVWRDWIKEGVDSGGLFSAVLKLDGEDVGLMTWSFVESPNSSIKELLISTAIAESKKIGFLPLLKTFAVKIAKQTNCDYIRFHTVRKGLVKQAIALGFYPTEIVMRYKVQE